MVGASVLHGWAGWRRGTVRFDAPDLAVMPHKANAARRHHIPRPKRRVTNWSKYNEALRRRGSLTGWFTDKAIAAWKAAPRTMPGGQPHYSDLAITTALTLRAVFHLALRQTEGLIGSVLQLLGLDLSVPDYSTLSRRAQSLDLPAQPRATGGAIHLLVDSSGLKLGGPGEWLVEKHGTSKRRSWRKLHIGFDAVSGRIVASLLSDRDVDDASQVGPLLDQIAEPVELFMGDGGYDRTNVRSIRVSGWSAGEQPGERRAGLCLGIWRCERTQTGQDSKAASAAR